MLQPIPGTAAAAASAAAAAESTPRKRKRAEDGEDGEEQTGSIVLYKRRTVERSLAKAGDKAIVTHGKETREYTWATPADIEKFKNLTKVDGYFAYKTTTSRRKDKLDIFYVYTSAPGLVFHMEEVPTALAAKARACPGQFIRMGNGARAIETRGTLRPHLAVRRLPFATRAGNCLPGAAAVVLMRQFKFTDDQLRQVFAKLDGFMTVKELVLCLHMTDLRLRRVDTLDCGYPWVLVMDDVHTVAVDMMHGLVFDPANLTKEGNIAPIEIAEMEVLGLGEERKYYVIF